MKKTSALLALPSLLLFAATNLMPQTAAVHCQVPWGIFADQLRFETAPEKAEALKNAIFDLYRA